MYSLRLSCKPEEVDLLSAELWEAGTGGIHELDNGDAVTLIAGFENNEFHRYLLENFARHSPEWRHVEATDWVAKTQNAWPARAVGRRLFLAPPWCEDPTPPGRERIIHNPGLACGTGEHPCTQLALEALEECMVPGYRLLDVGTGSGILAIAVLRFGASLGIGIDNDALALTTARKNFQLNDLTPLLVAGSAECIADHWSDVTVANISGTVLLSILGELLRVTRLHGRLILTGFPESELHVFQRTFPDAAVKQANEWRCLTAKLS